MKIQQGSQQQVIEKIVRNASANVGVDFGYLYKTAMRESSLNPSAKAATSSASGLFQFIDQTWLQTVKEDGPRHGYGNVAQHIVKMSDGTFDVPNHRLKRKILSLRFDPQMSSTMAAAFTQKNSRHLQATLGRQPTQGELYIAHFMGANGAEDLIKAAASRPNDNAANLFPKQARSNKPIFYQGGRSRSVLQVYHVLTAKHRQPLQLATKPQPAVTPYLAQLHNGIDQRPQPAKKNTLFSLFTGGRPKRTSPQPTREVQTTAAPQVIQNPQSNIVTGNINNTKPQPLFTAANNAPSTNITPDAQRSHFHSLYTHNRPHSTHTGQNNAFQSRQALLQGLRPSAASASLQQNMAPARLNQNLLFSKDAAPQNLKQPNQKNSLFNLLFSNRQN